MHLPFIAHHNTVSVETADDLLPFRPVAPILVPPQRVCIYFAPHFLHHNNITVQAAKINCGEDYESLGRKYSDCDAKEELQGRDLNTGLIASDGRTRWMIEGSPSEKWDATRLRLAKAKVGFQNSMEKLSQELALAKKGP
jgi:hypothetical protein